MKVVYDAPFSLRVIVNVIMTVNPIYQSFYHLKVIYCMVLDLDNYIKFKTDLLLN